jgi:transcriptional regulator with XRE-family HTH domain
MEVAQLANVSVDWYTWLEQGRPVTPSVQVLESLVTALRLNADERVHLFLLARQQPPPKQPSNHLSVSPALQHFLDLQGDNPAVVTDARQYTLAWNQAACVVFGDFSKMTDRELNSVWRLFTLPSYKKLHVDWEGSAREVLARFRAGYNHFLEDIELRELIRDVMKVSPEFREWWGEHEVINIPESQKMFNHPYQGRLSFNRLSFKLYDDPDLAVTVFTATPGTNTAQKMRRLLEERDLPPEE